MLLQCAGLEAGTFCHLHLCIESLEVSFGVLFFPDFIQREENATLVKDHKQQYLLPLFSLVLHEISMKGGQTYEGGRRAATHTHALRFQSPVIPAKAAMITRADRKSQVRQCLDFYSADS